MDLEREQPGSYRQWVESYVACVQFMDHQLGRLMEALDASPRGKETMIILWSDHGFHLGERHHMEKFMLWEKTTRIPLIVVLPGTTLGHQRCDTPVDLSTLCPNAFGSCRRALNHSLRWQKSDPSAEKPGSRLADSCHHDLLTRKPCHPFAAMALHSLCRWIGRALRPLGRP